MVTERRKDAFQSCRKLLTLLVVCHEASRAGYVFEQRFDAEAQVIYKEIHTDLAYDLAGHDITTAFGH